LLIVLGTDHAEDAGCLAGTAITAGLSLHEYEFDVVLDHGIRLVRLAEESAAARDFVIGIGDLVPNDRGQVIKPNCLAMLLNVRVQRYDSMPAVVLSSRQADIADVDNEAAAGH